MKLEPHVEKLLKQRYYQPGEDWPALVKRVVENTCSKEPQDFKDLIYDLILNRVFLPNSPCLVNAGTKNNGLVACFTVGPEKDTLEAHTEALSDIAVVGKFGGGCGFTGSFIRPAGSVVNGSAHDGGKGIAYGPNKWALQVSNYLDMITQGGFRKMAMMYALDAEHGDIESFIDLKQNGDESRGYNFNQSVMASDNWMAEAVYEPNSEPARLLNKIAYNAWNNGEPGLLFSSIINNNTPYKTCGCKINTTNPCGEQPLPAYLACVLASINVAHDIFWHEGRFLYDTFDTVSRHVTHFLDNVGTATSLPNGRFYLKYAMHRPIGLGIMGLADAFLRRNIKYGAAESLEFTENIFRTMQRASYAESERLGQVRGIPEHCRAVGRRNITTLTNAPTGSIAFIANCSHGIEPIFSKEYIRTDERGETYTFKHPLADDSNFVEAQDLTWKQHLDIQVAAQLHVDAGVSKTINLPNSATVEDVKVALIYAWRNGCKGVTVYRDGSRQKEVITTGKVKNTHYKRPSKLEADIYSVRPNGTNFAVAVGLLEEDPYEVFVFEHPKITGRGAIVKNGPRNYDLILNEGQVIKDIGGKSSSEEQVIARLISLNLRHGVDIRFIVEQLSKAQGSVTSYGASVNRALKYYVNGSTGLRCLECNSKSIVIAQGCEVCETCGSSKCG